MRPPSIKTSALGRSVSVLRRRHDGDGLRVRWQRRCYGKRGRAFVDEHAFGAGVRQVATHRFDGDVETMRRLGDGDTAVVTCVRQDASSAFDAAHL
jgi:hypothetical protein